VVLTLRGKSPKCALNRWPPAASSAAVSAHDLLGDLWKVDLQDRLSMGAKIYLEMACS
jgi:hypothetical protein